MLPIGLDTRFIQRVSTCEAARSLENPYPSQRVEMSFLGVVVMLVVISADIVLSRQQKIQQLPNNTSALSVSVGGV